MLAAEKAKDFWPTTKRLFSQLGIFKLRLAASISCAIIGTIFSTMGPLIMGSATTTLFSGVIAKLSGTGGIDFPRIFGILRTLAALYISSSAFSYLNHFLLAKVSQKVAFDFRTSMAAKIGKLPMSYFDTRTHGEILSRVSNDVDTIAMNFNQVLTQVINAFVTISGIVIIMFSVNVMMTLAAIVMVPLSMGAIRLVVKISQAHFNRQQAYLGDVNGQVEEAYSGHIVLKAFNKEKDFIEEFSDTNQKLADSAWRSQFLSGLMQPLTMFIGNVSYLGMSILGGYLAINGTITVGQIQSFVQYVRNLNMPINQMAQMMSMLQSTAAAAERVFEFLDEKEEETTGKEIYIDPSDVEGNVQFDEVFFGYDPSKMVVKGFSADVKAGQKIAIVGHTGAGKTTIVKLLMRFYDINEGDISIDGNSIYSYDRHSLRKLFGMVLQDAWLFNGSIMENIRYGREDATDEDVEKAAKAARAEHFISTLPSGYNMVLSEDATNISQGQKQLLTIARAILADPKILILDEATSSVDTRTEELIQLAMDELMSTRTSFIIAHRLSTIKNADIILVMADGDIIEQGSHRELLESGGHYAQLYNSQFEDVS
ncbi:MAG: ABC transporter ATP-binding protein/permease [Eubacteriaceae bacterium]|nr:ABC transporter ATP-binding protein/permease [Eubacteriaceae bacterium]